MKIISSKPKGQRIYKCIKFNHTTVGKTKRPFWIEPIETDFMFNYKKLEWTQNPNTYKDSVSSYYAMGHCGLKNAYSLKAVIRLVNKWKAPKGTKFRASLPFIGYDFILTKNN